jgi:CRP-like cAMP-binding protein
MNDRDLAGALHGHPTFATLDEHCLGIVVACARSVEIPAGAELFREGEAADRCYAVLTGRVELQVHVPTRGVVTVETLGAGDVVGWSWLFPPYQYQFDAIATDAIHAVELDGVRLRNACARDDHLGSVLMHRFARAVTAHLQATRLRLVDVSGHAQRD